MDTRLIIDPAASGAWNMAVDEALLHSAAVDGTMTLRFYGWSEPTLSLGYFQAAAGRHQHEHSRRCALVRRSTGGGAIVHDRELTYSFTTPVPTRQRAAVQQLYDTFHQALVDQLSARGVAARLCCQATAEGHSQSSNFLCFNRRVVGDVLLGKHKIAGSAQRRHGRAVLQHGSVLLGTSAAAPELPGLGELAGLHIDTEELAQQWTQSISRALGLEAQVQPLSDRELKHAESLQTRKFDQPSWSLRR